VIWQTDVPPERVLPGRSPSRPAATGRTAPDRSRPEASDEQAAGRSRDRVSPRDLPIGEVCQQLGLSSRTLRYYEEQGLLPGVRRRAGGRRVYGPDAVERLRFIQRLKALGLSLAEIRELGAVYGIAGSTQAMLRRLAALLDHRLGELDGRLAELARLRDEIAKYRGRVASRLGAGKAEEGG